MTRNKSWIRPAMIAIFILFIGIIATPVLSEIEVNTGQIITDTNSPNIIINKYDTTDEFIVSSVNSIINTCSCTPKKDIIKIYNAGKIPNSYKITTNSEFITTSQPIVSLQPQESVDVILYIDTPCKEFSQNIQVTVKASTGKEKVLDQEIKADFCKNFAIQKLNSSKLNYEPCELQIHQVAIYNTGDFKDIYKFTTSDFKESITYSENPLVVQPKSEKTLYLYFQPDCSLYATQSFTLTADSEKTPLQAKTEITTNILKNYNYSTYMGDQVMQCNMQYSEYDLHITNHANIANKYKLTIEGPTWASLSTQELIINSKNSSKVKLILAPTLKKVQNEQITVTILSELGNIQKTETINVNVTDCYTYEVKPQYEKSLLTCADDTTTYFEIKNTGSLTNTYDLSLQTENEDDETEQSFASLRSNQITILSGETGTIIVDLNLPNENFNEKITLTTQTFSKEFQKTTTQKITVKNTQECYDTINSIKGKYTHNRSENNETFKIKNVGFKSATYDLETDKDWITLSNESVTLSPEQEEELTITFTPTNEVVDAKYQAKVTINYEDKYTKDANFIIKIRNKTILQRISDYFSPQATIPKLNCTDILSQGLCDNRYFEMNENQKLKINLSQHYIDPDGDKLTYDVVNFSENLSVSIKKDIATVKVKNNWYGLGEVIFSASDEELTTNSEKFYIQSIDQPDNYFRIFIGKYWIILLLSILLLVLAIIIFIVKNKDEKKVIYKEIKEDRESKKIIPVAVVDMPKKERKPKKKTAKKVTSPKVAPVVKAPASKPKTSTKTSTKATPKKTTAVKATPVKKPIVSQIPLPKKLKRKVTRRTIIEEIEEDEAQN